MCHFGSSTIGTPVATHPRNLQEEAYVSAHADGVHIVPRIAEIMHQVLGPDPCAMACTVKEEQGRPLRIVQTGLEQDLQLLAIGKLVPSAVDGVLLWGCCFASPAQVQSCTARSRGGAFTAQALRILRLANHRAHGNEIRRRVYYRIALECITP